MRTIILTMCLGGLLTTVTRADEKADTSALIKKVIAAYGGEEELAKIKAVTITTKSVLPDGRVLLNEMIVQLPEQALRVSVVEGDEKDREVEVVNGAEAYLHEKGKTKALDKVGRASFLARVHRMMLTNLPLVLQSKDYKVESLGESKIGKVKAFGLKVTGKHFTEYDLYYDKATGRLVKTEVNFKKEGKHKGSRQETFYEDYKDIGDGLERATKIRFVVNGEERRTSEVTEYKVHTSTLSKETFQKP